jgi:hypothetical protein
MDSRLLRWRVLWTLEPRMGGLSLSAYIRLIRG